MGETYYDVLGVDSDASAEEIKAAYRERVLETHPDHNDAPDAAEQFKRVSTAKSVLTDGDERARYDRLGHDAYVRLGEHSAGASGADDATDSSSSDSAGDASSSGSGSAKRGTETGTKSTSDSRRRTTGGRRTGRRSGGATRTGTGASASSGSRREAGESHHARQRKRRRQHRAKQRATSGWSVGTGSATDTAETNASASGAARRAGADAVGAASDGNLNDDAAFRYAVHDWTDDVELEWEGRSIEYSTAVAIGCCWLLYPILVASTLTTVFPFVINVVVFACTLGVIGYTLTRPRVATGLFGSWSILFPVGIDWLPVSQFSLIGLVALGFAWVPFGYAVALWWALRP